MTNDNSYKHRFRTDNPLIFLEDFFKVPVIISPEPFLQKVTFYVENSKCKRQFRLSDTLIYFEHAHIVFIKLFYRLISDKYKKDFIKRYLTSRTEESLQCDELFETEESMFIKIGEEAYWEYNKISDVLYTTSGFRIKNNVLLETRPIRYLFFLKKTYKPTNGYEEFLIKNTIRYHLDLIKKDEETYWYSFKNFNRIIDESLLDMKGINEYKDQMQQDVIKTGFIQILNDLLVLDTYEERSTYMKKHNIIIR